MIRTLSLLKAIFQPAPGAGHRFHPLGSSGLRREGSETTEQMFPIFLLSRVGRAGLPALDTWGRCSPHSGGAQRDGVERVVSGGGVQAL